MEEVLPSIYEGWDGQGKLLGHYTPHTSFQVTPGSSPYISPKLEYSLGNMAFLNCLINIVPQAKWHAILLLEVFIHYENL